jgi:hypothetical protein
MGRSDSGSTALTVLLLIASVLIAAGCGLASGSSGGSGGEPKFSITSPSDGDEVELPFTVRVSTSEELGPEESGKDHWHLYFDGKEAEFEVITSTSARIDNLSPGEHTIEAALQHADHSPVGPEDEISVTVAGRAGGSASEGGAGGTDDDSLYDY